jgi:uncharacterized lipoprotein NlpE involved in copper resistance
MKKIIIVFSIMLLVGCENKKNDNILPLIKDKTIKEEKNSIKLSKVGMSVDETYTDGFSSEIEISNEDKTNKLKYNCKNSHCFNVDSYVVID